MEKQLKNSKAVLFPLITVIVLIALTIGVANFLISRINTTRAETAQVQQKNDVLSERLSTLQAVEGEILEGVNVASIALPSQNPSVLITNVVKNLAVENNVFISKFAVTALGTTTSSVPDASVDVVESYDVSFEASAESYDSLSTFINELSTTRPILNLSSIITESANTSGVTTQIKLTTYSAPFPQELPALDEPLSGLSVEEQETLVLIESYTAPQIAGGDVAPSEVPPRENPFSLDI